MGKQGDGMRKELRMFVDIDNGDIRMLGEWYTFECIEEIYHEIKPHLEKRRTNGLIEGESARADHDKVKT